jgi:hypothetical protein
MSELASNGQLPLFEGETNLISTEAPTEEMNVIEFHSKRTLADIGQIALTGFPGAAER